MKRFGKPLVVVAALLVMPAAATGESLRTFSGHSAAINAVAFSPSGAQLATGSTDRTARLWDPSTGSATVLRGHVDMVTAVIFSADGDLLTASLDGTLREWKPTGTVEDTVSFGRGVHSIALSADFGWFAVGTGVLLGVPQLLATEFATGTLVLLSNPEDAGGNYIASAVSAAPPRVLAIHVPALLPGFGSVRLWDPTTKESLVDEIELGSVRGAAFSSDGAAFAYAVEGRARLAESQTGRTIRTFTGHGGVVTSVAFSPDGTRLLTGSADNTARLWNTANGAVVGAFVGHTADVNAVAFSPDGAQVLTGSADGTARLWSSGLSTLPTSTPPATPTPAPTGSTLRYAALGDSFSSGEGVPPYLPRTNEPGVNQCHRSQHAYSQIAPSIPSMSFERTFVACSGARTENVRHGGAAQWKEGRSESNPDGTSQLDQIAGQPWDLVTITIGGNDLGFEPILKYCARRLACQNDRPFKANGNNITLNEAVVARLEELRANTLNSHFGEVKSVAPGGAAIILGYPQVVPLALHPVCGPATTVYSAQERASFRRWTADLNLVIKQAAEQVGIHYVDPSDCKAAGPACFVGHEACAPSRKPWFNATTAHPNLAGQAAYARLLTKYIKDRIAAGAPLLTNGLPENPASIDSMAALVEAPGVPIPSFGELQVKPTVGGCEREGRYAPGESIGITGAGFDGGDSVSVRLVVGEGGDEIDLGQILADEAGGIDTLVAIPATAPAGGLATVEAVGLRPDGGGLLLIELIELVSSASTDSDDDGVPDLCDNCPNDSNADQVDTDSDGEGDVCDACREDAANDFDNDGLCTAADPCPFDEENDSDSDGICEFEDNCPLTHNPEQADADRDGRGDACSGIPCYAIAVAVTPSDSGGVSITPPNCGSDLYQSGTMVEISAVAADGFVFEEWSGDLASEQNPIAVSVERTLDVTAAFAPVVNTVTNTPNLTPSFTPSSTQAAAITPTATLTRSPMPIHSATSTPTPPALTCTGDCDGNGAVTVSELIRGVSIALGGQSIDRCLAMDRNRDQAVTVGELVASVSNALAGCPSPAA